MGMSAASPVGELRPSYTSTWPSTFATPSVPRHVAHPGHRAGHERAAAAEHERPLAGGHRLAHRRADGGGHGEHVAAAHHAGLGVTALVPDPDVQVAAVAGAEQVHQARLAHGARRVLGPSAAADRVDGHADDRPPLMARVCHDAAKAAEGERHGSAVVHFEVIGKDGGKLA